MDSAGAERDRIEGYLPPNWFSARLEMGLGRVAFMNKKWAQAKGHFDTVAQDYAALDIAAEAIYLSGVCQYKLANDHTVLGGVAKKLTEKYPGNEWTLKSLPWAH
jgi:TolA-binding protein